MNGDITRKLLALQADLAIKAQDMSIGEYFREQYKLIGTHVIPVIIKHSKSESELELQYLNTKSNLSTLKMVMNASKGIFTEDEEKSEVDGLVIPNGAGQLSFILNFT